MLQSLDDSGYLKVPSLIDPALADLLYGIFRLRHWRGEFTRDAQVPQAATFHDDATLDAILITAWHRIEELSACKLVPTYAYGRLYLHGNVLTQHRDRPACEVSASVHLGHDGVAATLWFEPGTKIDLDPGDGVLYLGHRTAHWRTRFDGTTHAQLFLHYVQEPGPYAQHRLDKKAYRFPQSFLG